MLPAFLQTPAAVVLVLGGLLACFAGYRIFRVVLGIYGFILGVLLASSVVGTEHTVWTVVASIGFGVIGALLLIAAYFVGVALIGAGLGAMVANVIWAGIGGEPHVLVVILLAIAGALAALALQRYVIIIATAFGGAQTVVVGAAALLGNPAAAEAAVRNVYSVYPLDPVPATLVDAAAALALGVAGMLVQLFVTAKSRKGK
ncbi:MAG TPA: DUF4203 domain-containing protein [Vicinamibacterales bacterium]|nr:DUF4203 domain-containing protein [Vicinamibacterales bacterium]